MAATAAILCPGAETAIAGGSGDDHRHVKQDVPTCRGGSGGYEQGVHAGLIGNRKGGYEHGSACRPGAQEGRYEQGSACMPGAQERGYEQHYKLTPLIYQAPD